MASEDRLRKNGWRPIVSDAQASQLLRRQLKLLAKRQQRHGIGIRDQRELLAIKPGNWWKILDSSFLKDRPMIIRRHSPPTKGDQ